jgi:subtilisin family serine protease
MRFLPSLILILASLATDAASVPADLNAALANSDQVRVLVNLRVTVANRSSDDLRKAAIVASADRVLAQMPKTGHWRVVRQFSLVPAMALEVDAASIDALARSPDVASMALDAGGSGQMAESGPLARVPQAFARGYTGAGGKIAVIDTGLSLSHGDFAGRIAAQQCFCAGPSGGVGCCPNGLDTQAGDGAAEDDHGHGTNVAGIAAGGGAVALRGSAPAATIVAVKVLDGNNRFCCISDVIAALDWVRANHPDTDVINASLGTSQLYTGACDAANPAMTTAVNNLLAVGTMVFVSSGNQASPTRMAAPACIENAIAVGAVWDAPRGSATVLGCTEATVVADQPTCFTNSNANTDLYAPGALVTSSGISGGLSTFAGTSMATPLSAGCATAIRARIPEATPDQIEAALKASPARVTDSKNGLQFPRLDCEAAAVLISGNIGIDEPSLIRYPLPTPNPANASCPSGFFAAVVDDGPGTGLEPGAFGMEVLLDEPGTRVLAGGLNFGGLIDFGQVGFAGFTIANSTNEAQRLNLRLTGSPASSSTASLPVRIRIGVRPDPQTNITAFETTQTIAMDSPYLTSIDLPPAFYEVTVAPLDGAVGGAPEGQFYFSLTTSFIDRTGGGFQGGAVVGGYHAAHPFGGVSGFAGFCLATPHTTSLRVLSRPSYGPTGAGDLRLRLQDAQQRDLVIVPGG